MPELPEVETIRRDLERHLPGKRVASLWTSGKPLRMARLLDVRALRKVAVGNCITNAAPLGQVPAHRHRGRRGDPRPPRHERPPARPGRQGRTRAYTHVILGLDGGKSCASSIRAASAGSAPCHDIEHEPDELAVLGVDPYDPAFTDEHLHGLTRASKRSMKAFLMDQSKIAGLGNIYVVEALHGAEIHPAARADRLSKARSLPCAATWPFSMSAANRGTTAPKCYRDARREGAQPVLVASTTATTAVRVAHEDSPGRRPGRARFSAPVAKRSRSNTGLLRLKPAWRRAIDSTMMAHLARPAGMETVARDESDEGLMLRYQSETCALSRSCSPDTASRCSTSSCATWASPRRPKISLQEVLRIIKGADSYQRQAKFTTWMYTIARNQ